MSQSPHIPTVLRRGMLWLTLLPAFVGAPVAAFGQDPLQELKKELLLPKPYIDPRSTDELRQELLKKVDERERRIGKLIDGIPNSFSQLRQALVFKEWGDLPMPPPSGALEAAVSDARLRAKIAHRYIAKVRAITKHGDDDSTSTPTAAAGKTT